jgi:NDP-sugar pyrophosphorylase family protein
VLPAIVLTAGLGTRLDPLTRLVAKPAVPIGSRTLVEHVVDWLRGQQVTDLVLNLHHRPETITRVLGDGAHLGMRVRYSWEDPILGSAGGPKRALSLLSTERVLIVNGDTVCRLDLPAMLAFHERTGAEVTLALIPNPAPTRYNGLVVDEADSVRERAPKAEGRPDTWHFVGVQIAEARAFAGLAADAPAGTIPGLYLQMAEERPGSVRGWRIDAAFTDVGTPSDYLQAALAADGNAEPVPGVARSVVWPEARMAANVQIDECIVAGPIALPAGFRARRSVIVPAAVLRPDEHVQTAGDLALFPL